MQQSDFFRVQYPEPHIGRTRAIMAAHPEVRQLFGNNPWTALWTALIVAAQFAIAALLQKVGATFWQVLAASFLVGGVLGHALFVIMHEATHNLVFKGTLANRWIGMFANLPVVFPGAMGFRKFHLIHHRHQGEMDRDADLAGPVEARIVGNSPLRKVLWLAVFAVVEGVVRPARLKNYQVLDRWTLTNLAVQLVATGAFVALTGWTALLYLTLSLFFSVGLHPLGARWIQEHYVVHGPETAPQETYSYYGPFNRVMFNVGYHNEHHDLMMVPWNKLKQLKAMAPEFYEPLYAHQSYWKLLFQFIFDRRLSLYSRVIRPSRSAAAEAAASGRAAAVEPGLQPAPSAS
jgi:sphingolipid 4-desaturase/C4-monooxygenase